MTELFHSALPEDWRRAQAGGLYSTSTRGKSLYEEGFIHCSYRHQIERVTAAIFDDVDDVVLLEMDTDQIPARIIEENLDGGDELFPHLYRPLEIGWVIDAHRWARRNDGSYRLADLGL